MKPIKNGGYTILEMIVVVAIMAIALALVGLSLRTVFALNAKECAKDIAAELGKEKVSAMTRTGEVYLRLYKTDTGVYIDTYENGSPVEQGIKVGKAAVSVTWYADPALSPTGITLDNNGIILAFNKSDGSFMTLDQAAALHDEPGYPDFQAYTGDYVRKLEVSGSTSSRIITLWPQTGKIDLSA